MLKLHLVVNDNHSPEEFAEMIRRAIFNSFRRLEAYEEADDILNFHRIQCGSAFERKIEEEFAEIMLCTVGEPLDYALYADYLFHTRDNLPTCRLTPDEWLYHYRENVAEAD